MTDMHRVLIPYTNTAWLALTAAERTAFLAGATATVRGRSYPVPGFLLQTTDGVVVGRVEGC